MESIQSRAKSHDSVCLPSAVLRRPDAKSPQFALVLTITFAHQPYDLAGLQHDRPARPTPAPVALAATDAVAPPFRG